MQLTRRLAVCALLLTGLGAAHTAVTARADGAVQITMTSPTSAQVLDSSVLVSGLTTSPHDDVRVVSVSVDGGPSVVAEGTRRWSVRTPVQGFGSHSLQISAFDAEGGSRTLHRIITARAAAPPVMPTSTLPVGDVTADGLRWKQVFTDDFTTPTSQFPGKAYGDRWMVYDKGSRDTSGHGKYDAGSALSVHNGVLDFHLALDPTTNVFEGAAALPAKDGHYLHQLYGRYVMRYRVSDPGVGWKFAPLLWPYDDNSWPQNGEVDFPESDLSAGSVGAGFLHWGNPSLTAPGTFTDGNHSFLTGKPVAQWHTAVIEWTPLGVTMSLVDTSPVVTQTFTFHNPVHELRWTLQAETSTTGVWPIWSDPADIQVDWVAQYSLLP